MTLLERGPELAELVAHLAAVRRSGGRLVLVAGEAGIGKTAHVRTEYPAEPLACE